MAPDITSEDVEQEGGAEPTRMLDLGAAAPSRRQTPCLIVTSGDSALGLVFRLKGEMVIGRTHGCDILLAEADVSRRHAKVTVHDDGRVGVTDLGSSNGLLYQGVRVTSAFVTEGARIGIGRATLTLLWMDDVETLLDRNQGVMGRRGSSGLVSRRYFLDVLAWELGQPRHQGEVIVVACIAVDDFAAKRDARGAGAAESYVDRVATAIVQTLQDPEIPIGRTADDEVSIVKKADSLEAATVAMSLVARRAAGLAPITVSVGIAAASGAVGEKASTLFARAQRALLQAKASGGAQVRVAS